MVYIQ